LYFHRISGICLTYKLVILNHERIKTLNSSCLFSFFFLSFWFYKKTHKKRYKHPHTIFHYFYSYTPITTYYKNKKFKINQIQFKNYKINPKNPGTVGKPSGIYKKSGGTSSPRVAAARKSKQTGALEQFPPSSLPCRLWRSLLPTTREKCTNNLFF